MLNRIMMICQNIYKVSIKCQELQLNKARMKCNLFLYKIHLQTINIHVQIFHYMVCECHLYQDIIQSISVIYALLQFSFHNLYFLFLRMKLKTQFFYYKYSIHKPNLYNLIVVHDILYKLLQIRHDYLAYCMN